MRFEGIYFEQIYIESGYFQTCGVRLPFVLSRDAHEILNRGDAEIKAFALRIASRQCTAFVRNLASRNLVRAWIMLNRNYTAFKRGQL
jgi:hypothetical protein